MYILSSYTANWQMRKKTGDTGMVKTATAEIVHTENNL